MDITGILLLKPAFRTKLLLRVQPANGGILILMSARLIADRKQLKRLVLRREGVLGTQLINTALTELQHQLALLVITIIPIRAVSA